MKEKRDQFGSRFAVLAAMTGSAVGLGNLWRFPYLVGTNGGAAFIILYLAFVLLLCLPIMMSEFMVGRRAKTNVFGTFKVLAPGTKWSGIGLLAVICAISIMSFYSVVGGWTINYLWKAITFSFQGMDTSQFSTMFQHSVTNTYEPLIFLFLFMLFTSIVLVMGIEKGIGSFSKYMMPLLFILVIAIAIRSVFLKGGGAGLEFLFKPDFSKITWGTVLAAMGQAFFSLSLGCGTIMTYGSYVDKKVNIFRTSSLTAFSDTGFAIIAGIAVMPAVFAYGTSPSEGPGLAFVTLPSIFSQMPFGSILAIFFFFLLFIAAITSAISLVEVAVSYLKEEFRMKRGIAIILSMLVISVIGVFCSLSQGVLSDVKIFGFNIFDTFDKLSANILMPLGGLLLIIFLGWKMKKADIMDELTNQGTISINHWVKETMYFIVKYIAPVAIIVIMVAGLL